MANTYVDYTATAAQTDFAFTFPYLEDEHVIVEIDGVQKTLTTDYTIVTSPSTKIVLTSGATAGQIVRVRRKSQPGTDLVDFENGSVLTESELDRAYQHNRYLNEEISELNDASLQKEAGGTDWDAGGSKIKNVGTPTLTADATTKQYVDDKVNQVSSGASAPPTKWVFTGTAGANTTYSVTGAEVNGDTAYDVSVDGSVLEPTTDYTVDPDTDTLTIVNTLSGGEDIVVIERGFGVAITGTIGADQLQSNAVTNSKIANDAVTTAKINNNAVTTAKINSSAVTTAKLADHSVTAVKISNTDSFFNVQTTGEVGIGTTNPGGKLHIQSDSDSTALMLGQNHLDSYIFNFFEDTLGNGTLLLGDKDGYDNVSVFPKVRIKTFGTSYFNGGNVGIGTTEPSAPLEVSSITGGIVFPRLTTIQRDAISTPTDGETIFNTTNNRLESYNGSDWVVVGNVVSKYDSGWVTSDGTTTVANSATLTFSHGLNTSAITAQLWVSGASNGSYPYLMDIQESFQDVNMVGAGITDITSTEITIQFSNTGYVYMNSSGQNAITTTNGHNASATGFVPFTNKYIRVVVIG